MMFKYIACISFIISLAICFLIHFATLIYGPFQKFVKLASISPKTSIQHSVFCHDCRWNIQRFSQQTWSGEGGAACTVQNGGAGSAPFSQRLPMLVPGPTNSSEKRLKSIEKLASLRSLPLKIMVSEFVSISFSMGPCQFQGV